MAIGRSALKSSPGTSLLCASVVNECYLPEESLNLHVKATPLMRRLVLLTRTRTLLSGKLFRFIHEDYEGQIPKGRDFLSLS